MKTAIKTDVFIYKDEPYHNAAIQRKLKDTLEENGLETSFYFSSPEDIIINKLLRFEKGRKISERQWLDVIGVIKVQGDSLDKNYLKTWSQKLNIMELLQKAFEEAGTIL